MMGQQNIEMDVESLQKSGRRRGSCLDVFVVMSIIFLFVAVAAVAVVVATVVMETPRKPAEFEARQTGDTPNPTYKVENFVYLGASSCELKTSTMHWAPIHYGEGTSVGSNFMFDADQNSLMPKRVGTYFIYIDLNLTCTYNCSAGLLSVHVGDKLTCEVELPAVADSRTVIRKCWTVSQINQQRVFAQMTVPKAGLENWKLERSGSGFGMFHVD